MQLGGATRGRTLGTGCDGERCESWSQAVQGELRVDVRPVDAVGLWGAAGLTRHELSGTGHAGLGMGWAVGGHAVLPLDGPRPALSLRYRRYDTRSGSKDDPRTESSAWALDGSANLVLGHMDQGVVFWAGPTWTVREAASVQVHEDDVQVDLDAKLPVGATLGAEFVSDPLGTPWKRTPRVSFGAEVQGIDAWGLSGWMALSY